MFRYRFTIFIVYLSQCKRHKNQITRVRSTILTGRLFSLTIRQTVLFLPVFQSDDQLNTIFCQCSICLRCSSDNSAITVPWRLATSGGLCDIGNNSKMQSIASFVSVLNKKDGYRQQNVRQRQKLISIIDYDVCMTFY